MSKKAEVMAFCGIDGCGKSTQLDIVHDYLTENGYNVFNARLSYFPLNDMGMSKLKDLVLKADSCLHIVKYYSYIELQERSKYDYILFDRHMLCYFAYAYAYQALPPKLLDCAYSVLSHPDLTFYFDVNVNCSLNRIYDHETKQIDKSENFETLAKAKEGYEHLLTLSDEPVIRIDANGPLVDTTKQVVLSLDRHLKR